MMKSTNKDDFCKSNFFGPNLKENANHRSIFAILILFTCYELIMSRVASLPFPTIFTGFIQNPSGFDVGRSSILYPKMAAGTAAASHFHRYCGWSRRRYTTGINIRRCLLTPATASLSSSSSQPMDIHTSKSYKQLGLPSSIYLFPAKLTTLYFSTSDDLSLNSFGVEN